MKRIEAMEGPIMTEAINAYRATTATERFREVERLRLLARSNEAAALRNARDEERKEVTAEWQEVVSKKDAALADKDAENARLRQLLAELQSRPGKLN